MKTFKMTITRNQAHNLQYIKHWGRGKCTWNQKSWNGVEFTEAIAYLNNDLISKHNEICKYTGIENKINMQ